MRSSRISLPWLLGCLISALAARAQTPVDGFDVERLYPSGPGAGWFVMDSLDMHGGTRGRPLLLGRATCMEPLRVTSGTGRRTRSRFGVRPDRGRHHLAFLAILVRLRLPVRGEGPGATLSGYRYPAVDVDFGTNPTTLSDVRIGVDARLLGAGTALPAGGLGRSLDSRAARRRSTSATGHTAGWRRVLLAGDVGAFTYAGDTWASTPTARRRGVPGAPRGSELLLGGRGGSEAVRGRDLWDGPSGRRGFGDRVAGFFKRGRLGRGLLSARYGGNGGTGPQLRIELGAGAGSRLAVATPVVVRPGSKFTLEVWQANDAPGG